MQKSKLDKFISKYNLGGNVNSVKWKSSGGSLSTSFVTPDKNLLGKVKVDKFKFDDAELGIYTTDKLKSLIGVLGDDISLNVEKNGERAHTLKGKGGGNVSFDYVLSDLSVISDPPKMKTLPDFGTKIKLDSKFIDTFVKAKAALSDVDTFSIIKTKDNTCDVVIGYASSANTNRVNIPTECETCDVENPITFNANLFKEVLVANKECTSAVLEVSTDGLAKVNFKIDDFDSIYYIVSMQDID